MSHDQSPSPFDDCPALVLVPTHGLWLTADGEIEEEAPDAVRRRLEDGALPLVCHRKQIARRLGWRDMRALDVLELFAFVRPAQNCLPTARGLARVLGLPLPEDTAQEAQTLFRAATRLLRELQVTGQTADVVDLAISLGRTGWPWSRPILDAVGMDRASGHILGGLDVWNRLPEWQEAPPPPPPGDNAVSADEAASRLQQLLGPDSEERPGQQDYCRNLGPAWSPREAPGMPNMVLAEAGTGTGKTLGYVAPASLWAEKNGAAVWLSTYTRNLQRQLDQELGRLYPDPEVKHRKIVVRKGRENYLCLLNMEEHAGSAGLDPRMMLGAAMVARWARFSRDGDLMGGDFPGWLKDLVGPDVLAGLTDRRGECIYSACPHFKKCFIERNLRRGRFADIVIANHALVMIQAATAPDPSAMPPRLVFDEGHHLFDAADSAFSMAFSGADGAELRRWLRGSEGRSSRMKGLQARAADLVVDNEEAHEAMEDAIQAARCLPAEGFMARIQDGRNLGPAENFLGAVMRQVRARAQNQNGPFSIECHASPAAPDVLEAAEKLDEALEKLSGPLTGFAKRMENMVEEESETLDSASRFRLDALSRGVRRRADQVMHWRSMLEALKQEKPKDQQDGPAFVDWFGIERRNGQELDCGYYRHWLDPSQPFARTVLDNAHGVVVTSATLRDKAVAMEAADAAEDTPNPANKVKDNWASADIRTGASHLPVPPRRFGVASPFDYQSRCQVIVLTDVNRDNPDQIAAAWRSLIKASNGGALGLFTAIGRLRAIHERLVRPMEEMQLPLLAQHVDGMDIASLIDIFRAERNSVLLGTDAVRDGVDVPGDSLRLILFDRVPWPRPSILHKARRDAFGGWKYDEMLTRLKLKQAFGRLMRRGDDAGVFVMCDSRMPSKLLDAFPADVDVHRIGLADAVNLTRNFLAKWQVNPTGD